MNQQVPPVALRRSSFRSLAQKFSDEDPFVKTSATTNLGQSKSRADASSNNLTKISIGSPRHRAVPSPQHNHIKLVIANERQNIEHDSNQEYQTCDASNDDVLNSLMEDHKRTLDKINCQAHDCHRFRLLSKKITQILKEKVDMMQLKITELKGERRLTKTITHHDHENRKIEDLFSILKAKEDQIKDLECQLDDQRQLRLRDAAQVEEKAARIKDWVANKLRELENQNKQLREASKQQKDIIEKLREENDLIKQNQVDINQANHNIQVQNYVRSQSPIYDSVNVFDAREKRDEASADCADQPPPRPMHQVDAWEMLLYDLADKNFTSLAKSQQNRDSAHNERLRNTPYDSIDSSWDQDYSSSRKSSTSCKNDLASLIKPSFTTIDGEFVVDVESKEGNANDESDRKSVSHNEDSVGNQNSICTPIKGRSIPSRVHEGLLTNNLFDSPMRTRSSKDTILRAKSIRRKPAASQLYEYIASDLVKRGYLIKSGALKNHQRWFILKDFTLQSYRSEADEASKTTPSMTIKIDPSYTIRIQSSDELYPFRLISGDKILQLAAASAQQRDEWIRMLDLTIHLSGIDTRTLSEHNSLCEGIVTVTRQGVKKRCYANLIGDILFLLKSTSDPTPFHYVLLVGSKIREVTNDTSDATSEMSDYCADNAQDCSLAIYARYSMTPDPVYITLSDQRETDNWYCQLASASGVDQTHGTQYERSLLRLMLNNSTNIDENAFSSVECLLRNHRVLLYTDQPLKEPLTTLPNETLKSEALELFRSLLLFIRAPIEPNAIDYHVCLLQTSLSRFMKHPELRNEFYAQLVKQCTYAAHPFSKRTKSSSGSSDSASVDDHSTSDTQTGPCECQFLTDESSIANQHQCEIRASRISHKSNDSSERKSNKHRHSAASKDSHCILVPDSNEALQVLKVLALTVSLHLPRGRIRWWLRQHLERYANANSSLGKYAMYILSSLDRTLVNGPRDNIPSRTEIVSILLRNPYDHSSPHSLPVSFVDGSYLLVEADGSTSVEEFFKKMTTMIEVRESHISDFYLFADDPSGVGGLHILEPQRKILDIWGWWEQTCKHHNSGRYQHTKTIRVTCKKRLPLHVEHGETDQERYLIAHQINQEIVSQSIPISEDLTIELAALMTQLIHGDMKAHQQAEEFTDTLIGQYIPEQKLGTPNLNRKLVERWEKLRGRSGNDCVRIYLNCMRRLNPKCQ